MIFFPMMTTRMTKMISSTKKVPLGRRKMLAVVIWLYLTALAAKTYTNTTMNSRLMKYMASTRPTVRKKY
jgi:hypothetical protein